MLDVTSILNLLRFILWPKIWCILENIPCVLEKIVQYVAVRHNVLLYVFWSIFLMCHLSPIFPYWFFCLDDLSIVDSYLHFLSVLFFSSDWVTQLSCLWVYWFFLLLDLIFYWAPLLNFSMQLLYISVLWFLLGTVRCFLSLHQNSHFDHALLSWPKWASL